jgi:dephospho-CoA kinase
MLKVGLTGGLASGKSTALEMFASHGAHILRADLVGHQLMAPGQAVYQSIVSAFGSGILAADLTISRPLLSALAFPNRIAELNAIVHPAVLLYEDNWMRQKEEADPHGVAICEAALLIEAGGVARFDRMIVVTCPLELKVARFAERTGTTPELAAVEVATRMAAQMPEAAKAAMADYVIDNSGTKKELARRIAEIWKELSAAAKET